jgi:hypothetical protein
MGLWETLWGIDVILSVNKTFAILKWQLVIILAALPLSAQIDATTTAPVIDNERVKVWDITLIPGKPTLVPRRQGAVVTMFLVGGKIRSTKENGETMHFHDKDVLVVYRYDGSLKSTTPDGKSVVNDYKSGSIWFNRGNRAHFEELVKGQQSAMMMELK